MTSVSFANPKTLLAYLAKHKDKTNNKTSKHNMSDNLDPLNLDIDINDVDTSSPSLAPGEIPMRIVKVEVKPSAKNPSDNYFVVQLQTIDTATSTKGTAINPGFNAFYRMALQQNQSDNAPDFKIALAKFSDAVFGERRQPREFPESVGKTVLAVIKPTKDTTYGESEIKYLKTFIEG